MTALQSLTVESVALDGAACSAEAAALPLLRQLEALELPDCSLGDAGASALAAVLPTTALRTLHLAGNALHDKGGCSARICAG